MYRSRIWIVVGVLAASATLVAGQLRTSRAVRFQDDQGTFSLDNGPIAVTWRAANGKLSFVSSRTANGAETPAFAQPFTLTLGDGRQISAGDMIAGGVAGAPIAASATSPRLGDRFNGYRATVQLRDAAIPGPITWSVELREGARYWRQRVTIGPLTSAIWIKTIRLIDAPASDGAAVVGSVQGSPIVSGDMFLGFEHPMSTCRVAEGRMSCDLARGEVPVPAGQALELSSVVGVAEPGQLRRSFDTYLERERVHPYRPFLHYNSWYDLGYFTPYTEKDALGVIDAFGRELVQKRGVKLSSFLFDDGWDSHKSLWSFNEGFPRGFTPLKSEAEKFKAAPGVWMSPFGGYGGPRNERLEFGKAEGFETNSRGFALSGPTYYKRFRDVCIEMLTKYGINQFKFDGIGRATGTVPGSQFGSDFEAAIHLIRDEIRAVKPDVFVNLTTGTWPSPFWVQYADSIWRGGEDHSFAGVGTKRQQWMTYRDAQTYKNVVRGGPLYPLSSLMLHGIIYAAHAKDLDTDPGNDFTSDVRAYFGTGTQLQEMYVTPSLLTPANWDALAEAATWARANADVLVDTHWIGGDPVKLEVYGHAAWTARLGIVVLRNPSDQQMTFDLDVDKAFELPKGAVQTYRATSPWKEDASKPAIDFVAGSARTLTLKPFEVLTLEFRPLAVGHRP